MWQGHVGALRSPKELLYQKGAGSETKRGLDHNGAAVDDLYKHGSSVRIPLAVDNDEAAVNVFQHNFPVAGCALGRADSYRSGHRNNRCFALPQASQRKGDGAPIAKTERAIDG